MKAFAPDDSINFEKLFCQCIWLHVCGWLVESSTAIKKDSQWLRNPLSMARCIRGNSESGNLDKNMAMMAIWLMAMIEKWVATQPDTWGPLVILSPMHRKQLLHHTLLIRVKTQNMRDTDSADAMSKKSLALSKPVGATWKRWLGNVH